MPLEVGTHSGTFHADDVLAFALILRFVDDEATVVRTRCRDRLDQADIVVDVGGRFEPSERRFDHHQSSYQGPLSSAGMVLAWLEDSGTIEPDLAAALRRRLVDYVDAVDTGREAPPIGRPCFCQMVEAMTWSAQNAQEFDQEYRNAADVTVRLLDGLVAGFERTRQARDVVLAAMAAAVDDDRSVLILDRYYAWKPVYFACGGAEHPTRFVLFPSDDGTWKLVAIPPREGDFGQKQPLPASWAGLMGDELEAATGLAGSIFCHKNRFIAVFDSLETAVQAMKANDLYGL